MFLAFIDYIRYTKKTKIQVYNNLHESMIYFKGTMRR
jgi:hypothetical protein